MPAHEPQDQHPGAEAAKTTADTSAVPGAPGATETAPAAAETAPAAAGRAAVPSVRDLLAACAAAHTVSTPPGDGPRKDAA